MTTIVTEANQVSIPPEMSGSLTLTLAHVWSGPRPGKERLLSRRCQAAANWPGNSWGPAGAGWKPGVDPVGDLIREREQDDQLDQADEGR